MSADESITSLPEAVEKYGALPMPAGPAPVDAGPVVLPFALAEAQLDALAASGNRAVNDAVHEDLCACDAWPERCLSSGGFFQGYWDMGGLETAIPAVLGLWERMRGGELAAFRALELGDLDGRVSASCGNPSHPTWLRAEIDPRGCPWCEIDQAHQDVIGANLARYEEEQENARLRARIAELEATPLAWADRLDAKSLDNLLISLGQATEHEPMDEAIGQIHLILAGFREAVASASGGECACPPVDRPHQVGCPLDGVPLSGERPVNGLTKTFSPVASLREPVGEFDAYLRHPYRTGHDLPETGSQR